VARQGRDMRSEAEIREAMAKFEAALSLRVAEVSSLDEKDRHFLIKSANLTKQIKNLKERIEWCKWMLGT
jgi:hypothetical protein